MTRENGLQNFRINFNLVVNRRFGTAPTWAQRYDNYFSKITTATGTTNITWEKVLKLWKNKTLKIMLFLFLPFYIE